MSAIDRFPLAALAVLTLATGCATTRPIAPLDTSAAAWRAPELDERELSAAGIAVLPVRPEAPGDTAEAQQAGPRLAAALEARQLCAVVLPPSEVRERFAREGVLERFERMVQRLPQTQSLDRETLDAMGRATGCRYFLQASIRSGVSHERAIVDGAPRVSRAATTTIFAQVWDAATGEVVWEGEGGGAALTDAPHAGTPQQTLSIAISGLARVAARDPSTLPAPREVAELHHRDHLAAAEVNAENGRRADAAVVGLELVNVMLHVAAATR